MSTHRTIHIALVAVGVLLASGSVALAAQEPLTEPVQSSPGLTDADLEALRIQGELEGWTFTVGRTSATERSIDELCGYVPPADGIRGATFRPRTPARDLPSSWDWREEGGTTPCKQQYPRGTCSAFAAIGVVESVIKIETGLELDLSEEWLATCGGSANYTGHFRHLHCNAGPSHQDSCGGHGAVLEKHFLYNAPPLVCGCPYPHYYCIGDENDAFINVGDEPTVTEIKQAIYDYGPVASTVDVNSAFLAYQGGVFNACGEGCDHAVALVGWDNDLGTNGAWILRNSWGTDWGTNGYMYIEYGCNDVGQDVLAVEYFPPDCNTNDVPDHCDTDCNLEGCDDYSTNCGESDDCTTNGVPDECEDDCNTNTVADSCDIASSTSEDCNSNGTPDECETGNDQDCNSNGVPDLCDLYHYTSYDCNRNGVPDECDIANETLARIIHQPTPRSVTRGCGRSQGRTGRLATGRGRSEP